MNRMRYRGIRALDHNSAPPLWVWFAVLGLVLVLLGISVPISHKMRLDLFNPSRLNHFKQTHGKITVPKIAVIGTSLTRNAFYKDEVMEQFAADHGKPIQFLRFTESAGDLGSSRKIADLVLAAAPEVIFFEAALFAISQDGEKSMNWKKRIADHRFLLFKFFRQSFLDIPFFSRFFEFLKISRWGDKDGNVTDVGLNVKRAGTPADFAKQKAFAPGFRVRDFSESEIYHDFFEAAAKRGVRIVFIDLARSKDKWEALPPMIENEVIALMNKYKMTYGITYIRFPYRLSSDYFIDGAHFGNKGRKFYSEWFIEQLPKVLSKENEW